MTLETASFLGSFSKAVNAEESPHSCCTMLAPDDGVLIWDRSLSKVPCFASRSSGVDSGGGDGGNDEVDDCDVVNFVVGSLMESSKTRQWCSLA